MSKNPENFDPLSEYILNGIEPYNQIQLIEEYESFAKLSPTFL